MVVDYKAVSEKILLKFQHALAALAAIHNFIISEPC